MKNDLPWFSASTKIQTVKWSKVFIQNKLKIKFSICKQKPRKSMFQEAARKILDSMITQEAVRDRTMDKPMEEGMIEVTIMILLI